MRALPTLIASLSLAFSSLPALAQVEIERSRPAPAKGEVSIDSPFGSITVRAWDKNQILVQGTLAAGAEGLELDGDREEVSVDVEVPEAWLHAPAEDAAFRSALEIFAPVGARISIETVNAEVTVFGFSGRVDARSVNGKLKVSGSTAAVELESMTGGLEAEGRIPSLALTTVSGPVVARGATGEISVETTSGDVWIEGSEVRRLEVESVTGKVSFKGSLLAQGEVEVETFSGAVRLELPRATRAAFELRSFAGAIKSDFCQGTPETRERLEPFRTLRCSTGAEGLEIRISTHDGEIVVAAGE